MNKFTNIKNGHISRATDSVDKTVLKDEEFDDEQCRKMININGSISKMNKFTNKKKWSYKSCDRQC